MTNKSHEAIDSRSLTRILYEKSTFGAVPTFFRIRGHEAWHPVQFIENTLLTALTFSDGTTHYISDEAKAFADNPGATMTFDELKESMRGNHDQTQRDFYASAIIDDTSIPADRLPPSIPSSEYAIGRRDANILQDLESDLSGAVTDNMTDDLRPEDEPTPGADSAADYIDEPGKPGIENAAYDGSGDSIADSLNSLLRPASTASDLKPDADTTHIAGKFKPKGFA